MPKLTSELYRQCRTVLLECHEFDRDDSLRAVFVTQELKPFKTGLPEASRKNERVDVTLDYLISKRLSDGRPVLPLFLKTLRDKYQPGDLLRDELDRLASDVVIALSDTPPTVPAAPQKRKARSKSRRTRIPLRTLWLLALLLLDSSMVVYWGWCLFGDQPNTLAYIQTVATVVGIPIAILALIFVVRRPVVLEDALHLLGTEQKWLYVVLAVTVVSVIITCFFWPLGWVGNCRPKPTITITSPLNEVVCRLNEECRFDVSGISSNIAPGQQVTVFVRDWDQWFPHKLFSIESDGTWQGQAQIGDIPCITAGKHLDIEAVVLTQADADAIPMEFQSLPEKYIAHSNRVALVTTYDPIPVDLSEATFEYDSNGIVTKTEVSGRSLAFDYYLEGGWGQAIVPLNGLDLSCAKQAGLAIAFSLDGRGESNTFEVKLEDDNTMCVWRRENLTDGRETVEIPLAHPFDTCWPKDEDKDEEMNWQEVKRIFFVVAQHPQDIGGAGQIEINDLALTAPIPDCIPVELRLNVRETHTKVWVEESLVFEGTTIDGTINICVSSSHKGKSIELQVIADGYGASTKSLLVEQDSSPQDIVLPTIPPCSDHPTPCLTPQTVGCPNNMQPIPGRIGNFCTDTIVLTSPVQACSVQITMTKRAMPAFGYSLWEVEAYGPDTGDENLLLYGDAIPSSTNDNRFAYYAVDGEMYIDDKPSRWDSEHESDPQSLIITLVKPAPIDRIVLIWEEAYAEEYCVTIR